MELKTGVGSKRLRATRSFAGAVSGDEFLFIYFYFLFPPRTMSAVRPEVSFFCVAELASSRPRGGL